MRKLDKKDIQDIVALTPLQEGLLFEYLKDPGGEGYFEQLDLTLSGPLDPGFFSRAWAAVAGANEVLRTLFRWEQVKEPVQVVLTRHRPEVRMHDFSGAGPGAEAEAGALAEKDRREPFDLGRVPFRVTLCLLPGEVSRVIISNHHILYDGWSNGIILSEFFRAYHALQEGRPVEIPPKTRFKEYVKWLDRGGGKERADYWTTCLEGFETRTELVPAGAAVDAPPGSDALHISLGDLLEKNFQEFVREQKLTPALVMYGAWAILLQRYTNSPDVMFGTTVSGRHAKLEGIEHMVGLFINTLPLRSTAAAGETVSAYLRRLDRELRPREAFEDTPLVEIKDYCALDKQKDLFDSLVVVENYPLDSRLIPAGCGLTFRSYSMYERTQYPVTLTINCFEGFHLDLVYHTRWLRPVETAAILNHFVAIIADMTAFPGKYTDDVSLLSEEETRQLLYRLNETETPYPPHPTIDALLARRAEQTPHHTAIICPSPASAAVSYRHLDILARRLAHHLAGLGVVPGSVVALMVKPSPLMMAGLLGILKSGCAYLPVDPAYPEDRILYMLKDSGARVLLTDMPLKDSYGAVGDIGVLDISSLHSRGGAPPPGPTVKSRPGDAAYVVYTSGSTGGPKGAVVEHRSAVNFITHMTRVLPFRPGASILALTTISFDIFILETLAPLSIGMKMVMADEGRRQDPDALVELITAARVNLLQLTPSRLQVLTAGGFGWLKGIETVMLGGEALPGALFERLSREFSGNIYNLYGPVETTVWSTLKELTGASSVTIGAPIANTRVYILDRLLRLLPAGRAGELYIAGDGLARGYINNPDQTRERFIPDPFFPNQRMYRTGDLARRLPDGDIRFLGRADQQVKIRGYRIEPGEIENALLRHPHITGAAVIPKTGDGGSAYLCAYMAVDEEVRLDQVKEFLARRLPDYMVPSHFSILDKLPKTPNNKIDRKALDAGAVPLRPAVEFAGPANRTQERVAGAWKEVLKLDRAGIHDNLFDVGGNSMTVTRLRARLEKEFEREIPVTVFFQHTTIHAQARYLDGGASPAAESAAPEPSPSAEGGAVSAPAADIAVIGMSGRFPGAPDIRRFWENLEQGVESISFFSQEELIEAGADAALVRQPGYVGAKGVLEGMEHFDAPFFDYTAKEAQMMDPQLRILHQCAWGALEDAGYDPFAFEGAIGLFAGATSNFPWMRELSAGLADSTDLFAHMIFNERDYLTTRVAYKLNLRGPCSTVQTACSTSLTAVALACRALAAGDCSMALAGGVGLTFPAKDGYLYREGMIFSPDGHCRAFDAAAKGTVGGNGAGLVVLKPLAEARRDRDAVYAVIKGAALNNDGIRKAGYTAPSVDGQAGVIRRAHRLARVHPESIGFVETHGTATPLGDPVELEALRQAFGTEKKHFCAIGSVKTNIGHLDGAAGIAGFIKAVLAVYHRRIPPSLHFKTPNPRLNMRESPFYVNTQAVPWKNPGAPLRAGVSSFGIGGTNVHVILEGVPAAPDAAGTGTEPVTPPFHLLPLSAKSPAALDTVLRNLEAYLRDHPGADPAGVAYTLAVGRRHFPHRKMLVCRDHGEALETFAAPARVRGFNAGPEPRPVIFMFPGIGGQYVNMARDLYRELSPFRREMDRCFGLLEPLLGRDIREVLYPAPGNAPEAPGNEENREIHRFEIAQLAVFCLEYSLARVSMGWGITPYAMIGYSFGEYTAACVAGVFTLEEMLALLVTRGRAVRETAAGAMLSVPLPREKVVPLLPAPLALAVDNGPSCIVAGASAEVESFAQRMKGEGCMCVPLDTATAVHSSLMEPAAEKIRRAVEGMSPSEPRIPYVSNVTGTWMTAADARDPGYWVRHLTGTVSFAGGIKHLLEDNENALFLEVGPGRDLSTLVRYHAPQQRMRFVLNLVRHPGEVVPDTRYLLNKLGYLYLYGVSIDWPAFYGRQPRNRLHLPTYPFQAVDFSRSQPAPGASALPGPGTAEILPGGRQPLERWFYVPQWKRSARLDLAPAEPPEDAAPLLVFAGREGLGAQWVQRLESGTAQFAVVVPGTGFKREPGDRYTRYTLAPGLDEHYRQLFRHLKEDGNLPTRVLHTWAALPAGNAGDFGTPDLCYYSLLAFARAAAEAPVTHPMHLTAVTAGLYDVNGTETIDPDKAVILGPCRVIPKEYPNIECRIVDVHLPIPENLPPEGQMGVQGAPPLGAPRAGAPGGPPEAMGRGMLDATLKRLELEVALDDSAAQVALRGKHRWIQDFESLELGSPPPRISRLKERGVYLLTGGLGGIGLVMAQFLAKQYSARLILTARTPLPPRETWDTAADGADERTAARIHSIRRLEALGAEVLVETAGVTDATAMRGVFQRARERFGPPDGVLHTAGVPDGALIQLRDRETCEKVFAAKIDGTRVLARLLQEQDNRGGFFMLFSSINTFTAPFGQVGYTAANAYLDALARAQASHSPPFPGLPYTVAVNWDAWKETGMAVDAHRRLREKGRGAAPPDDMQAGGMLEDGITSAEGTDVFCRVLAHHLPRVAVSTRPLPTVIREARQLPSADRAGEPGEPGEPNRPDTGPLQSREQLNLAVPYEPPSNHLENRVADIVKTFLHMEQVGINDSFFELGATSLDIVQLNGRLSKALDRDIPVVTLFRHPTVRALAKGLEKETAARPEGEDTGQKPDTGTNRIQRGRGNLGGRLNLRKKGVTNHE